MANDRLRAAQSGVLARAVETPVIGARAARFDDALLERFACTEHTDTSVARRQSLLLRKRLDGRARDFNRFECLGVFRLQRGGKSRHARANLRLHIGRGCFVRFKLTCEGLVRTIGSPTTPKLVDRGVPQRPIEPWDDGLVRGRLVRSRDHLRKPFLKDVLGQRAVSDSALQILQKRTVILEQRCDRTRMFDSVHHSIVRSCRPPQLMSP